MKTLLKIGSWLLLSPLVLLVALLLLVAIPLALLAGVLDIPFRKRREEKLAASIKDKWLPRHKYIYMTYTAETALATFIEEDILPKYGKYTIADKWSAAENTWTNGWGEKYTRVDGYLVGMLGDCDGIIDVCIAAILPTTNYVESIPDMLHLYSEADEVRVTFQKGNSADLKISQDDARKMIIEKIEASLEKWNVSQSV